MLYICTLVEPRINKASLEKLSRSNGISASPEVVELIDLCSSDEDEPGNITQILTYSHFWVYEI